MPPMIMMTDDEYNGTATAWMMHTEIRMKCDRSIEQKWAMHSFIDNRAHARTKNTHINATERV